VVVCPQGIDIRNGFQLECIACSRCIDACTGVMQQLGHPTLVGYSSLVEMRGGRRPRFLRPRTFAYAALLVGLVVTGAAMAWGRVPFEVTVNRAPGSLFTADADGAIRNTFLLKITSNEPRPEPVTYTVRVDGLPGAELIVPEFTLRPGESHTGPLIVRLAATDGVERTIPFRVIVSAPSGAVAVAATFKTGAAVGVE
jgi:polyferredoxin